jgi:putative ABC transport system permease protein
VAGLSLALGVGAVTLVFSLVDAVLLRPFPYRDDGSLVFLWGSRSTTETPPLRHDLREWRTTSLTFEDADVFLDRMTVTLGARESDTIAAACIGPRVVSILGVQPVIGRAFSAADASPDSPRAVILSDALWRARFGADAAIVGQSVSLGGVLQGTAHTVIGVMPPGFFFPDLDARLWTTTPCVVDETQMHGLGRLKPGATPEQAQGEMDAMNQRARRANPELRRVTGVFPIRQVVVGDYRRALWLMLAAVAAVLLIACVNVAHLQFSRGIDRQTELAVRSAAGATRARLIRQLLTESALLALVATVGGLGLSWAGLRVVQRLALTDVPRIDTASLDTRVLAVALAACAATALVSGLWPAWKASRVQADEALRPGGSATSGARSGQLRDLLAASEVALATVLLVTAALVVRSFVELVRADWGFKPDNLLLVDVRRPASVYGDAAASLEWTQRAVDAVQRIPGVVAVSHSTGVPIRWKAWTPREVAVDGRIISLTAGIWTIGDGYIAAAGIPLLRGRGFSRADDARSPRIVVSRAFAEHAWPGGEAIGRRVQVLEVRPEARETFLERHRARMPLDWSVVQATGGLSWEVIGVVENVQMFGLEIESNPAVYLVEGHLPPELRMVRPDTQLLVRASRRDSSLPAAARNAILALDRGAAFTEIAWMEDLVAQSIGGRGTNRLLLVVSTGFGALALGFAAIGIYGMMSLSLSQRLRELAIRTAVGASRSDIVRAVFGRMVRSLCAGLALGVTAAWAATRGLESLLFGIRPLDAASYVLAVAALVAAALLACVVPLRRALRLDAMAALKT